MSNANEPRLIHSFWYQGNLCNILQASYAEGGRPALIVVAANHPDNLDKSIWAGEQITVLTLNLPDEPLEEGEYHIKDYSGNEWIVSDLITQGFLEPTGAHAEAGFVSVPVCTINPAEENS